MRRKYLDEHPELAKEIEDQIRAQLLTVQVKGGDIESVVDEEAEA